MIKQYLALWLQRKLAGGQIIIHRR
jgi:hypothetical protein